MNLTRSTALDGDAILPLADAKAHLRVRHDDEDTLIAALRDAAIVHIERISGVVLAESTFLWTMRAFPCRVDLPMGPVTDIVSASYLDAQGVAQLYADFRLVGSEVLPAVDGSWPYANGYAAVEFTAGLASPDEAPDLLAAVKLMLGHLYENRSAATEKALSAAPLAVDALVQTHRSVLV